MHPPKCPLPGFPELTLTRPEFGFDHESSPGPCVCHVNLPGMCSDDHMLYLSRQLVSDTTEP